MEETGCEIISAALATLAVKGLMMMMMKYSIVIKRPSGRGGLKLALIS